MSIGKRLLPSLVDNIAATDPTRVLYSVPETNNIPDGFRDITAKDFARSVDRCAWHLESNLGPSGPNFPTLTYMGPQDVVYAILILACIKTGYKVLLSSPRNTLEAHVSLFEETQCDTLLMPPNFPLPVVKGILEARKMRVLNIPKWQYLVKEEATETEDKPYPYDRKFSEARLEPFVVLHTSGSTGLPKAIVQTHATWAALDKFTTISSHGKKPTYPSMCAGERVYLAFPLFHCAGVGMLLPGPIYTGFTVVLGPFPPSVDVVNAMHVHGNVKHSCLAPFTLVDLVKDKEHLDNLSRLDLISFGGGPCPKAVGDLISTKTRLINCLGSTECGVLPNELCDSEDWAYMSISPMLGHEYRHYSGDLYEQVIVKNPDFEEFQGIFGTFPDMEEWPMRDLFTKHPTKDNAWLYQGRTDDIIVFSTGEKLNPLDMEGMINSHPEIGATLVAGVGRFQASLLLEAVKPPTNESEKESLIERIWPTVRAANAKVPSHARVHRHMILFSSPEMPMLRAGKGTVQRKLTLDLYGAEIEALYKEADGKSMVNSSGANWSGTVEDSVKRIVATSTDIDTADLDPNADLFELRLDSLQVTLITREINKLLSAAGKSLSMETRIVYTNPTIASLAAAVVGIFEGRDPLIKRESDEEKMQKLYQLYAENMPLSARSPQTNGSGQLVVLLTGSTGSLGSYILDSLASDKRVSRIYCLNRGPESSERQYKSQQAKGIQPLSSMVQLLDADFSKSHFGLSIPEYKILLESVTTIIHNAWNVDFNKTLDSFVSQIRNVRHLIDFSSHSQFGAEIFFISSISAVANWSGTNSSPTNEGIPEKPLEDWHLPEPTGYGQSKFIAERILETAAKEASIPVNICRVGQVAGPTTELGVWPKQEWLPSLITSSKYLKKLPEELGVMNDVDWIPVDVLGRTVVELAIHSNSHKSDIGAKVYHATNPKRVAWKEMVPKISKCLDIEGTMEIVPLAEWVSALRESVAGTDDVARNPAAKLVDFYESLARKTGDCLFLSTTETVKLSKNLAGLQAVQEDWIRNWMRQWAF
ncbi:acetyl-CoA synthetase-like protein [Corynespora cassiicola Philippines]|uniref:Acetyl-CoA synthetase-like protein n=1 Tax=Corynespora cassiicola Philippines TaxID=1448308 RepID=A0A2T2P6D2_CORCC|nr:acetyl-CoA synthetase-like protein [Corynespora cassiicola Philippines]